MNDLVELTFLFVHLNAVIYSSFAANYFIRQPVRDIFHPTVKGFIYVNVYITLVSITDQEMETI